MFQNSSLSALLPRIRFSKKVNIEDPSNRNDEDRRRVPRSPSLEGFLGLTLKPSSGDASNPRKSWKLLPSSPRTFLFSSKSNSRLPLLAEEASQRQATPSNYGALSEGEHCPLEEDPVSHSVHVDTTVTERQTQNSFNSTTNRKPSSQWHVDLDKVAEHVSAEVGSPVTAEELILTLNDASAVASFRDDGEGPSTTHFDFVHTESHEVECLENSHKVSQKFILRPQEPHGMALGSPARRRSSLLSEENTPLAQNRLAPEDVAGGFAVGVPVRTSEEEGGDVADPAEEVLPLNCFPKGPVEFDYVPEGEPLLPRLDSSDQNSEGNASNSGSTHIPLKEITAQKDVQITLERPLFEGARLASFLPVVDSMHNIKEMLVVVPPEEKQDDVDDTDQETDPVQTAIGVVAGSIPPMTQQQTDLEFIQTQSNQTPKAVFTFNRYTTPVGYGVLLVALFAVASQGTAALWLPSVRGLVALSWLSQTQTLLTLPFFIAQLWFMTSEERAEATSRSTWKLIVIASFARDIWAAGFFLAIRKTSLFHAWTLNNMHTVLLVAAAVSRETIRASSRKVTKRERQGALLAAAGALCMQFSLLLKRDFHAILGNIISAAGSLGAIVFLEVCKELRGRIPLFIMMLPLSFLNAVSFSVIAVMLQGNDWTVSDNGVLGWLARDRLALGMYLGGVVGFLGTVSCVFALKMLPPVVVGSVQTMMPVLGTVLAILAGVSTLPDAWTTFGGLVLLLGVLLIANATHVSEHKVEIRAETSGTTVT